MSDLPWLVSMRPPTGSFSLYCFPHSGGSPGEFARWAEHLPDVDVYAVQLPGRAARVSEQPFTRMVPLVSALATTLSFNPPFGFFGHSLGGWVAYEVAVALRAAGREEPAQLFISECPAPGAAPRAGTAHRLPADRLLALLEEQSGPLPDEIHDDPEFLELVLAPFRADLELAETYTPTSAEPLSCPITVIAAEATRAGTEPLRAWRTHAGGRFTFRTVAGDHFYIRSDLANLLRIITAVINTSPTPRKDAHGF